ncbi:hypothetical protein [Chryseobacterium caseinilyticum]|uniref:Translation elongation factor EFTu/EF1A C-terminal domain-containing protein n=1 Tax=Chryseobacterium caseinilyticum TaxID=2771428 RepID=A0ABR8Z849_9FLAO|nr:hypothetical protein [Chryseobacterium caseinilyticum]MBD8081474.1 hypothetical protein [Chryseobacterium caseinilyticum]
MKKPSHFTALINYYQTEKGGVVNPISTGFRASFQFPFELQTYFGSQNFEDPELIFPGDSVSVEVTLINAESFLSKLYTGMDFEISDNSGVIGNGVISEVYSR